MAMEDSRPAWEFARIDQVRRRGRFYTQPEKLRLVTEQVTRKSAVADGGFHWLRLGDAPEFDEPHKHARRVVESTQDGQVVETEDHTRCGNYSAHCRAEVPVTVERVADPWIDGWAVTTTVHLPGGEVRAAAPLIVEAKPADGRPGERSKFAGMYCEHLDSPSADGFVAGDPPPDTECSETLLAELNALGRESWEAYAEELADGTTAIPRGFGAGTNWTRRTFWLRRAVR
jgi:hypothetical protein